jgi:hypothetical protein
MNNRPHPRTDFFMSPSRLPILTAFASILAVCVPRIASADEGGGMRSPGLFGAGLFMTGAGAVGLGVGAHFFSQGSGACDGISETTIPTVADLEGCKTGVIEQVGGAVGMITGGAFVLIGVPLMIVGGTSDDPEAPQVAVSIGPSRASLSLSF